MREAKKYAKYAFPQCHAARLQTSHAAFAITTRVDGNKYASCLLSPRVAFRLPSFGFLRYKCRQTSRFFLFLLAY